MRPLLAVFLVSALTSAPAWAQEGGFTSELERVADASPEEKVAYVEASVREIEDSHAIVQAMMDEARDARDNQTIQCVSGRLRDLTALESVSQQAERDMINAMGAQNFERASHEFRKVAVALQRSRMLLAEAERCVGGQELADGETSVQYVGDEDDVIFGDSGLDIDDTDIGFDPPDVSPFR